MPGPELTVTRNEFDPARGLPYPSGSIGSLRVDAPLEALTDAEIGAFLRSVHRALAATGRAEIAVGAPHGARVEREAVLAGFLDRELRTEGERGRLVLRKALDAAAIPLVSIVVPTYKPDYFGEALASACEQTYPNLEIAISDNCPTEAIAELTRRFAASSPVRYERHAQLRYHNTQHCFEIARGRYVKFLLDDDLLDRDCVRRMVLAFEAFGSELSLVTSRRRRIDERGTPLADDATTLPLAIADTRIAGAELGRRILSTGTNSIGEFTTAMFRKADLEMQRPFFWSWQGREYPASGDLSCWLHLLSRGDAYYFADPLSSFRIHAAQNTRGGDESARLVGLLEWIDLMHDGRAAGFLTDDADYLRALKTVRRLVRSRREGFSAPRLAELDRALAALDREADALRARGPLSALRRLFGGR